MRPVAVILVLLLAPLAGCVGAPGAAVDPVAEAANETAATPGPAAEPEPEPPAATLVVRARMPDHAAVPGAEITVRDQTRVTDAQGLARFDALAPGEAEVVARKAAHRTARLMVDVPAGGELRVDVVLPPDGNDQHAHEDGLFAHVDVYTFEGRFDCSATYVIITGDCLLLVDNVTTTAGAPARPGDATAERHVIDFPLDPTWSALVVELAWHAAVDTDATGSGMTLALEPADAPTDGYAVKYARVAGHSPLRVDLTPGVEHPTATTGHMPNPAGGEVIRARAFVMGAAHNPGGTSFLGASVATDHEFTLHVSIFYGDEPVPPGYTAVPP